MFSMSPLEATMLLEKMVKHTVNSNILPFLAMQMVIWANQQVCLIFLNFMNNDLYF